MPKVIATDLDGTLFYPKKTVRMISSPNRKFLQKFIDEGNRVVIVSGRNHYFSNKVVEKIGRPVDIIGCNSAYIKINGQIVKETFFPKKRIKEILDEITKDFHPMGYFLMSKEENFVINKKGVRSIVGFVYFCYYTAQGVYREPYYQSEELFVKEINKGQVYKIMVFIGAGKKRKARAKEINKILRERYGEEIESSWIGEFIELTPKQCSKANGIKFYLDYLNIDYDDVMVVGDSGNDISMFAEFPDHSFCMEHASPTVKKYAKHTIRRFSDLEDYLDIKEK